MPAPRFHPFARLIFCALGALAVATLLSIALAIIGVFVSLSTGKSPTAQILELNARFALPLLVISYPPTLLWVWFCRTRFDRRSMISLGLRARRALPDFWRGALVGTLAIAVLWSVLWLTGTISVAGWSSDALEMGLARALLILAGYATLFFAVGFFEEVLLRGYALHNLNHWLGWSGAVAAQATVFALIHLGNLAGGSTAARLSSIGALPSLFLIAVFFALSYRKTGSLWFPIGFHFAWNFCLGCLFSLPVSGISIFHVLDVDGNQGNWLSGGAFGAEGSPFLIPILIALLIYIRRAPDHPQALLDLELLNRATALPAPAIELPALEPEEPALPNRYGTKFGTSQGFSADTLRELRELQETREREQAEAREAAKREELARLAAAAPVPTVLEPLVLKPAPETPVPQLASAVVVEAPTPKREVVTPKPEALKTEPPTVETVAPPKTPSDEPVKKKPPSPRW